MLAASPLLTLALLAARAAGSNLSRLRGGALSRDEIIDKLNRVPTFAIVNDEGVVVPMQSTDGGGSDVCWFTDAAEAQECLALTLAANPAAAGSLKLACSPLGVVFDLCKGWPVADGEEEAEPTQYLGGILKVQGPRAVEDASVNAALQEQALAQGLPPIAWQVAIFCHDDFQTPQSKLLFGSARL